ncbi:hypothetical protein CROQUDRAFT_91703 [Cronartium quercuum f. sp. fusiforme G11]|uniref:Uncharacterized protein n=1 Tax=Cronartium quercuum f. sp. fusiforme G11 TaxID=708437 RepID=A0A9P6NPI4_9BASI|nr:hypothetical protein CROQUDRAFT_91703 [Cronartium quercuum f. sp. fusiforme G11]
MIKRNRFRFERTVADVVAPGPGPLGARLRHRREPISGAGGSGAEAVQSIEESSVATAGGRKWITVHSVVDRGWREAAVNEVLRMPSLSWYLG